MNKILLFIPAALLSSALSFGQTADKDEKASDGSGFRVNVGAGYAFPLSGDAGKGSTTIGVLTAGNNELETFHFKRSSHSTGLNSNIGAEYMFSKYIGFACNANIAIATGNYSNGFRDMNSYFDSLTGKFAQYSDVETWKSETTVLLMPALLVQNNGAHFNFYSRAGVVIPVVDRISVGYEDNYARGLVNTAYEFKMKFTLGYTGAVGCRYNVSPRLSVWGEVNFVSFAPSVKERTITKSTLNGADSLSAYLPQEKKTEYALSGSSPVNVYRRNNELLRSTYTLSYSNAGAQLGLSVNLGNSRKMQPEKKQAFKKGAYLKAGMGFAFQSQSNSTGQYNYSGTLTDYNNSSNDLTNESFKYKPFSFMSGLNSIIGGGYMLSKHIGLEFDAMVGLSEKKFSWNMYDVTAGSSDNYSAFDYAQVKIPVLLIPAVVLQTGGELVNAYARTGAVLPLSVKVTEQTGEVQQQSNYIITRDITSRFTLGYSAAAGLSYKIDKYFMVWAEANFISLSPFVKEEKTTEYLVNGKSIMGSYPTSLQNQQYKFSGSSELGPVNSSGPLDNQTFSLPFSNVGFIVGVSVPF